MSVLVVITVALLLAAFGLALRLPLQAGDWRLAGLAALLGALIVHQGLGAYRLLLEAGGGADLAGGWVLTTDGPGELAGLLVGVVAVVALLLLGRLQRDRQAADSLAERHQSRLLRLEAAEQRFRDFAEIASDWYWESDREHRLTYVSPRMEEVTGMPAEAFLGRYRGDVSGVARDLSDWRQHAADLEARRSFRNFAYVLRMPESEVRHVRISGKPLFDRTGAFVGYRGVGSDISNERRLAESRLQAEQRFARAIDSLPVAFTLYDADDRLVACNKVYRETYYTDEVAPVPGDRFEDMMRRFSQSGSIAGSAAEAEALVERRLDRRRNPAKQVQFQLRGGAWIETTDYLLDDGMIIVIGVDVTERKRAEESLRRHEAELAQALRRGSLDEMTASLAHELNQPLAALSNYAGGCLRRIRRGDPAQADFQEVLEEITREAQRATNVVRGMAKFLDRSLPEAEPVEVVDLLASVEQLAGSEILAAQARSRFVVARDLPPLRIVRIEIEQVLLNLIRNALEAVQDVPLESRRISVAASLRDACWLDIIVTDSGLGFSSRALDLAFSPFFSTKPEGLGVGLAIGRRIAEAHDGSLSLDHSGPEGTALRLSLPVSLPTTKERSRAA